MNRTERYQAREYAWSGKERAHQLQAQNGRCPVCDDLLRHGRGGMATDHNHAGCLPRHKGRRVFVYPEPEADRGPIRAILCTPCNTLAGRVDDSPLRLLELFERTGTLRYLWLARFLAAMDAPDEWVPTRIPLVREAPVSHGLRCSDRHIGSAHD
jgi:hypothetical protein